MKLVEELYRENQNYLELELIAGKEGLKKKIGLPQVHRPGLSLAGFMKNFIHRRLLIFGNNELLYLKELTPELALQRLRTVLTNETPAVIVAGKYKAPQSIIKLCKEQGLPLFKTNLPTVELVSKLTFLLADEFAPSMSCHGTFLEAFGVGVLIQGDSAIGKSEAALGLIDRGHRLISDDVVKLLRRKDSVIEGRGPELNRHIMEIRGIGIINVAHLYGAVCVRDVKSLDIIVKLEEWDDEAFYDRVGLDERYVEMLGVNIPYYILPVKPGRDVVLLLETIVLNHRLKLMGLHSAREFNVKLLETISRKQKEVANEKTLHQQ